MTRSYLITNDEGHALEVYNHPAFGEDHITIHSNYRALHTGNGSCGFSRSMAKQLVNGLLAILSGEFDRAVTETQLRLEAEQESRALRASENHLQQIFSPIPSLDTL